MKAREALFEDQSDDFLCQNCQTGFCFRCGREPHPVGCVLCRPEAIIVEEEPVEQQDEAQPAPDENIEGNINVADGAAQQEPQAIQPPDACGTAGIDGRQGQNAFAQTELNRENDPVDVKAIKQCPRCTVDIEKIGGCNRMTCRSCRCAFCWLCLAEMPDYSHYCGEDRNDRGQQGRQGAGQGLENPVINLSYLRELLAENADNMDDFTDMLEMIEDLERYAHYYNRYHCHGQGQLFAELQCPCLEERAINYTHLAGIQTGMDTDFIQSANETLVASRRMLKYAYCSAYHMPQSFRNQEMPSIGFIQLSRLERFTEELSEISETAVSRQDRHRSMELVRIISVEY
jgi:hypothetical protein